MRAISLRARMGLVAGLAVAIAVIAVAVSAYAGTRSDLRGQIDSSLQHITTAYLHHGEGDGNEPGGDRGPATNQPPPGSNQNNQQSFFFGAGTDCDRGLGINNPAEPAFGGARGFVQLITPDGGICPGASEKLRIPADQQARALAHSSSGQYFTDKTVAGHHIRVLATAVRGIGALEVALPLSDVDHTLSKELLLVVLIAIGGILLAGLLGFLVARTAVAPIARFTRQTERIAANPERLEHERLDVHGDDELARLAGTFNSTLDALERSIESQRNLVADASHELRTPIATLRANLQLLHDEHLLSPEDRTALRSDMIEELDELTALVSDVVELARGSKISGSTGEVRLDQIVSEGLERARRRAPGLQFDVEVEPTLVRGEGHRIARAVTNVLDNAAKWSPERGTVEVRLRGGVLTVRDHGPGFHTEDLPFVFDRFHRARDARSKPGSGLGLAIVRQAADAHDGFAEAANHPDGGAVLRVSFGPTLALSESAPISA